MFTVLAVIGEPGAGVLDPAAAALVTLTHEPTATLDSAALTELVNVVEELKFTVTWPLVGFCTSMLFPLIAAAVPNVPGADAGPDGELACGVVVLEPADGVLDPPQAPSATASAPPISARPGRAQRCDAERGCRADMCCSRW